VKKSKQLNLYSAIYITFLFLKRSLMAVCQKGITQFYLPPTHEPYLPLLTSRKASPPFDWYSLRLLRRNGQAELTWCWYVYVTPGTP